jgi:DNA-binding transcriptional MerR regulator
MFANAASRGRVIAGVTGAVGASRRHMSAVNDFRTLEVAPMKTKNTVSDLAAKLRGLMSFSPIDASGTYTIGELAAHLRVSLRTLRFYEQAGLLQPGRDGLRRLYSPSDLERLEVIVTLRELEVSLTSIKSLMAMVDGGGAGVGERITQQVEQIFGELADANRQRIDELEEINRRLVVARGSFSVQAD